ncbi:uncharacterized protein CELE_M01A8.1 [Caenorhabditis elegans]|uniref:Isoform b of Uncharacterized protein M01A8.1 n=1 Tax=Caenorhabditis elegans TaxID=6239 RepID=P34530-2|nr:Uncharacterized protein CELE_M01A8.1 [Caenorhabditis elegans]CAA81606.1 Uncharacterized protein CELE_M01A8.1 [Caenorhabditis elegans]|eukprot:NP_001254983.1 Uncharacterized protein CELE_M01A8.1 [Caenorhabditis elegans]
MCFFLLCFLDSFRNRDTTQSDTDVIYPRDDPRASRSHQNFGFMDPPPRYEQIFKRGGGTPSVITTREAPSVTRSTGDGSLPPSYEQAALNARRESRPQLPQGTLREVPLTAIDMEHPAMSTPSSTVLDMESEITNITNHAQACVHRYDASHANEVTRTAVAVTTESPAPAQSTSNALPELEAPEGGPPGYDTISLHNETVSTR